MFSGAILWSGIHVCAALNSAGVSDNTISACSGHEQVVGGIAIMWGALLFVYWALFALKRR